VVVAEAHPAAHHGAFRGPGDRGASLAPGPASALVADRAARSGPIPPTPARRSVRDRRRRLSRRLHHRSEQRHLPPRARTTQRPAWLRACVLARAARGRRAARAARSPWSILGHRPRVAPFRSRPAESRPRSHVGGRDACARQARAAPRRPGDRASLTELPSRLSCGLLRRRGPRRNVVAGLSRRLRGTRARRPLRGVSGFSYAARSLPGKGQDTPPRGFHRGPAPLPLARSAGDATKGRSRLRPHAADRARADRRHREGPDDGRRRHPDVHRHLLRGRPRDAQLLRATLPRVPRLQRGARLRDQDRRQGERAGAAAEAPLASEMEAADAHDVGCDRPLPAARAPVEAHAGCAGGARRVP